jgi:hypothetical protein
LFVVGGSSDYYKERIKVAQHGQIMWTCDEPKIMDNLSWVPEVSERRKKQLQKVKDGLYKGACALLLPRVLAVLFSLTLRPHIRSPLSCWLGLLIRVTVSPCKAMVIFVSQGHFTMPGDIFSYSIEGKSFLASTW